MKKNISRLLSFLLGMFIFIPNTFAKTLAETSYKSAKEIEAINNYKGTITFGDIFVYLLVIILIGIYIYYLLKCKNNSIRLKSLIIPISSLFTIFIQTSVYSYTKYKVLTCLIVITLLILLELFLIIYNKYSLKKNIPEMNPKYLSIYIYIIDIFLILVSFIKSIGTIFKVIGIIELLLFSLIYSYNNKRFNKIYKRKVKMVMLDEE